MTREIVHGDSHAVLQSVASDSLDSCVTDPPYALTAKTGQVMPGRYEANKRVSAGGFMGLAWDADLPSLDLWREVFRVLKPGAHLIAFGGTRTYHRLATMVEAAGFEIRDQLAWVYLSGFPKSMDVSKAIDKAAGARREVVGRSDNGVGNRRGTMHGDDGFAAARSKTFDLTRAATAAAAAAAGWGTALKPAWEPIVLARKPFKGTVASCVIERGTGALNIDGGRIPYAGAEDADDARANASGDRGHADNRTRGLDDFTMGCGAFAALGRWPANIIAAPGCFAANEQKVFDLGAWFAREEARYDALNPWHRGVLSGLWPVPKPDVAEREAGLDGFETRRKSEARDDASWDKGSKNPRAVGGSTPRKNTHPTVKPVALMRYLIRLVTPKGGAVLEPFCGSGTTCVAAVQEGAGYLAVEREAEYVPIAKARTANALREWEGVPVAVKPESPLPLFDAAQTGGAA